MKYLLVLLLLLFCAPIVGAEDIMYTTDGVYVCYPISDSREEFEQKSYDREWKKYKFDKEIEARLSIEEMRQKVKK